MTADYRVIETGGRCRLGEGPYWSVRQQALFWVDILDRTLFRLRPRDGSVVTWQMPQMIGWLIERAHADGFVAGMQRDFVYLSLEPMTIAPIARPEPHTAGNRLNDAKADARGCIWAGTVPLSADGHTGSLYRLDPDGRVTCHDRGYLVTNGPAFSPDGRYLYHNDSGRGLVYRFEFDGDGALRDRRVFLRFSPDEGKPDGMTVDSEGALWIALWGAARVSRYSADGHLERSVSLPASQVTSCVFGGAALDRMFVTSAAEGADGEGMAGALFEIDPQVAGVAPNLFAA
jgi:sugar lactone lactonase YvrE